MEAWLILYSIATILINTTTKLSFTASARPPTQILHIQNSTFTNYAESSSFGLLHEKVNGENIHLIFENFSSSQITQSQCLFIKLSPDERFIKIGNILAPLYTHEYSTQKNRGINHNMASEIMGKICWSHL
eukprot:313810_1